MPRTRPNYALRRLTVFGCLALALLWVLSSVFDRGGPTAVAGAEPTPISVPAATASTAPASTPPPEAELEVDLDGCTISSRLLSPGDDGDDVSCTQKALAVAGVYDGPIDGVYSESVAGAARAFQSLEGLYVDGLVGKHTATALGIWPGDESFIVRTPPPAAGAMDSTGYLLSSVASTGDGAPGPPPDSGQGTGKRVVYSRAGQRVWAIGDDEQIIRSYLVTGSQYNNETPGLHHVYSKSEQATGWNLTATLPYMVRYLKTERGAIGFHQIPIHNADGTTYQTEAELGNRGSGGCQRQAELDAIFMWNFADVGTPVWVI